MKKQQCCINTQLENKPCKITADRLRDGKWYCHYHDPLGKHAKQTKQRLARPDRCCKIKSDGAQCRNIGDIKYLYNWYCSHHMPQVCSDERRENERLKNVIQELKDELKEKKAQSTVKITLALPANQIKKLVDSTNKDEPCLTLEDELALQSLDSIEVDDFDSV